MLSTDIRVDACRWLSKSGTLATHESVLRNYALIASKTEIAELYCYLRDHSQRWESEWRPEFLSIFGVGDADIPPVDDSERWAAILHGLVFEGDITKVRQFVEHIGIPRWDFPPEADATGIEVYPIDAEDDAGELPIAKARRLGHVEVAGYLDEVKRTIEERYRTKWNSAYGRKG